MPPTASRWICWTSGPARASQFTMNWRSPPRVKRQAHDVGRGSERRHGLGLEEEPEHAPATVVLHEDVPVTVHHDRRKRLLLGEYEAERLAHLAELGRTERGLPVDRRVARRGQQRILLVERHVEDAR